MTPSRLRPGFSLVELIVAMTILAIGMLGLVGTSMRVSRQMGETRRRQLGNAMVNSRLEQLRSKDWTCASLTSLAGVAQTPPAGETAWPGMTERWVWTAQSTKSFYVSDSVSWTGTKNQTRKVGMTSSVPCTI